MNVKTIANNLNKTETEIKDACKQVFGRVPTQLNSEIESKLREHFQSDSAQKQLFSSGAIESNQQQGISQQQHQQQPGIKLSADDLELKLETSRLDYLRTEGQSKAIRDFQVMDSAYDETFEVLKIEKHNRLNQRSVTNSIRSRHLGNYSSDINQIQQAEIIDIPLDSNEQQALPPQQLNLRSLLPPAKINLRSLLND